MKKGIMKIERSPDVETKIQTILSVFTHYLTVSVLAELSDDELSSLSRGVEQIQRRINLRYANTVILRCPPQEIDERNTFRRAK
jgi:hypothetical protein